MAVGTAAIYMDTATVVGWDDRTRQEREKNGIKMELGLCRDRRAGRRGFLYLLFWREDGVSVFFFFFFFPFLLYFFPVKMRHIRTFLLLDIYTCILAPHPTCCSFIVWWQESLSALLYLGFLCLALLAAIL